jgi:3-isopropylmalate/(R)-2-methylmalate dehydratase small subunit
MEPFVKLQGVAAALPIRNVDTDMIIPKQFLKTIKRTGLGIHLFDEMRNDMQGNEVADFVLNKEGYKNAQVLIAGENFGCGSSREHAPWALVDFGIRCVIAPSYADIFFNNCFKNGILPIRLSDEEVKELSDFAETGVHEMTVDLENQVIRGGNKEYKFEVDSFRKKCLLEGLDDIALTLEHKGKIDDFEGGKKVQTPWLFKESA